MSEAKGGERDRGNEEEMGERQRKFVRKERRERQRKQGRDG